MVSGWQAVHFQLIFQGRRQLQILWRFLSICRDSLATLIATRPSLIPLCSPFTLSCAVDANRKTHSMEVLAAIALSGNILQFAEFGIKLLRSSAELYSKEELGDVEILKGSITRMRSIANEKISQCKEFEEKFRLAYSGEPLPEILRNDALILDLCSQCLDITQDLQLTLQKLGLPAYSPSRGWQSFLAAVRSVLSEQEIASRVARLEEVKNTLTSAVLSSLSSKVDFVLIQQSKHFKELSEENQKIVSTLLHIEGSLTTDLRSQVSALSLLLSRLETVVIHQPSARIAAPDLEPMGNKRLSVDSGTSQAEGTLRREVTKSLLDMLAFNAIRDRFEVITEAHKKTFNWIFQMSAPLINPGVGDGDEEQPASFTTWLTEQPGIYWINGKAASGKSTLMKHIVSHPDTGRLLRSWVENAADTASNLRVASFFFWASGTKEQRSQAGLLRSILYELLVQDPELVPTVFPKQWSTLYSRSLGFNFDWDDGAGMPSSSAFLDQKFSWPLSQLEAALQTLVRQTQIPRKTCLFVDGLDEYEGDDGEIAALFAQITEGNDRVKCCVSSRPHKAFLNAFSNVRSLRLQDLTYPDIQQYVSDKLVADARMRQLAASHPSDVRSLIKEIVSSASGVFLWVRLVVASLLRGLGNDDGIDDLQARLRVLPKDLESLYRHMLLQVDEVYEQEASRIFLIVGAATSPRWDDWAGVIPLTALTLSFAVEDHQSLALTAPMHFIKQTEVVSRSRVLISKLGTRCGGLLEATNKRVGYDKAAVGFMHRTVKDFLQRPENQTFLHGRAAAKKAGRPFSPDFAILKSVVLSLKAQPGPIRGVNDFADSLLNVGILHARRVEFDFISCPEAAPLPDQASPIIDELIKAGHRWAKFYSPTWPVFHPGCTAYTVAVECGLHRYLGYLLEKDNIVQSRAREKDGKRSLLTVSMTMGGRYRNPRVVETLVEFGADAEQALGFITNYLLRERYVVTPDEDPNGDGKQELLAASRSLLLKVLPLQQRPAKMPDLSFLRGYPGDWEEVLRLAESIRQTARKRRRWIGLRGVLRGRRWLG
ncbi:hypothetical protein QBC40DRAFT_65709 [Triangularia verruculosa]|uniref:NACHT domain-containing protein n=1 Tax=Triangularia verruculosa TaxID=2587418 RepID=A0AAN6XWM1_9PEZI|nr:hypothetical protein QBC40DRAFT_65709 [Triangularia verruculosa]